MVIGAYDRFSLGGDAGLCIDDDDGLGWISPRLMVGPGPDAAEPGD